MAASPTLEIPPHSPLTLGGVFPMDNSNEGVHLVEVRMHEAKWRRTAALEQAGGIMSKYSAS